MERPRTEFNKLPMRSATRTMFYAGVGSRETPDPILAEMTALASELEAIGYTLRTGDAYGSDEAFRKGAKRKEVYGAKDATDVTKIIAMEIHPWPSALKEYPLMLMARNTNQIFGPNLDLPVDFVLAWTPDGAEHFSQRSRSTGGTGQAIEMASRKGIPVINLKNDGWLGKLQDLLEELGVWEAPAK